MHDPTRSYTTAVEQIFGILGAAWDDRENGAAAITKAVTGVEWGYVPAMEFPGREVVNYAGRIGGDAGYQTVTERRVDNTKQYVSTGMLGIHIRYPKNDSASVKIARLLAQTCQSAFRKTSSLWIAFSDSKIVEVGYLKGTYQINIFVTCKFEVDA